MRRKKEKVVKPENVINVPSVKKESFKILEETPGLVTPPEEVIPQPQAITNADTDTGGGGSGMKVDEATIDLWKSVFELEKNRFSFFDELFATGFVVDSLEVMSKGSKEEEHLVEAEEEDFTQKTDYGRVVFKTKHVYTGNFEDWYFHGQGRYVWVDGTAYQGDFVNGVMHGKGSISWPDGSVYEGEFVNGERAPGWNVYSTAEGFTYAGDWQNGLPHGDGKIWYDPASDDTDYFDGEWASGLQQGFGIRQYRNGDRYMGNWENGERSGKGTMIWLEERQVYKGHWQGGVPNGKGKHIWYLERSNRHVFPSRHVYFGDWVEGKRDGIGKMIYPCGSTYEGRWKDGQRNGKGVFLNPSGALITGLFKMGDLIGGSDVPLHAPTYDCDFGGLVEYLTEKFKLGVDTEMVEEGNLKETVIRFIEPLRQLYQRAGELGHSWGNNGLFPNWLKASSPSSQRIPNHHEQGRPPHMDPKAVKPQSLDGVYPVTRFGLWLLLKDCPQLTKDATIAVFDKHFSKTPSISFQTRHNPFEPVLLWQFLQCLVIVAVTIYLEIPNHKRKLRYPKSKINNAPKPRRNPPRKSVIPPSVSIQTPLEANGEQLQTQIFKKQAVKLPMRIATWESVHNKHPSHHHGHHAKKQSRISIGTSLQNRKSAMSGLDEASKGGTKIKHSVTQHHGHHHGRVHSDKLLDKESNEEGDEEENEDDHKMENEQSNVVRTSANLEDVEVEEGTNSKKGTDAKLSLIPEGSSGTEIQNSGNSIVDPVDKSEELGSNGVAPYSKIKDNPEEKDGKGTKKSAEGKSGKKSKGEKKGAVEIQDVMKTSPEWEEEESSDSGDDTLGLFDPAKQTNNVPYRLSISDAFEALLIEKLFPCLKLTPGKNLPLVPNPMPPLCDMFEAFQKCNGGTELISASQFIKTMLPHLSQPSSDDTIFWYRCSELLSAKANIDEIIQTQKQILSNIEAEDSLLLTNMLKNQGNENEFLGGNQSNPAFHKFISQNSMNIDDEGIKEPDNALEFMADALPFSEQDLPPEPFLWQEEQKCIRLQKSDKLNLAKDLTTQDILNVLRKLYPKLVGHTHDTNVHFDMVFCDWLWGISLASKLSADREMQEKLAPVPSSPPQPEEMISSHNLKSSIPVLEKDDTPAIPVPSPPPIQPTVGGNKGKSRKTDRDRDKDKDKEKDVDRDRAATV